MAGNSTFQLVNEKGWQAGLQNLLRAEMASWWKTRTWWVQSLIWVCVIDLLLITIVSAGGSADEPSMSILELISLYGIFGGMFTSVGVVIHMQGALVGEKISGTAAWVMSKPVARPAFVFSKLLGNALGIAMTSVIIPGIGAYLIFTQLKGEDLQLINFLGGRGILCLFAFYWMSLTLMLGAFFNSRGPVIGISLALILGMQFIQAIVAYISPALIHFLPYELAIPPQGDAAAAIVGHVILGTTSSTWMPVYSSVIAIAIFIWLGIWRFSKEEL